MGDFFSRFFAFGKKALQLFQTVIFINFYQNDIFPNLADTFPENTKFTVPAKKTAEFSRTGNDELGDLSGAGIKFHIDRAAETFAAAGIDYFFLFQFKNTHKDPL